MTHRVRQNGSHHHMRGAKFDKSGTMKTSASIPRQGLESCRKMKDLLKDDDAGPYVLIVLGLQGSAAEGHW